MSDLAVPHNHAGDHRQRYEDGHRLAAGCIPFRHRDFEETSGGKPEKVVEVLMINSLRGQGLVFPKGGWENDESVEEAASREAFEEAGVRGDIEEILGFYCFQSRRYCKESLCPEGLCKAAMFTMRVKEEMDSWPEQKARRRSWFSIPEAMERCKHPWMKQALLKWHEGNKFGDANAE